MQLLDENVTIINEDIKKALKDMGFEQMTPIQEQAIPVLLDGKDIIGQAQTGTGKTAAFGIPLLQCLDPEIQGVQAIVLCPTRELAIQASVEMHKFAKYLQGVQILPIYGGQDITRQIRSLRKGVQIVIGTPGRVMDHMRRKTLKLDQIKTIVLDEADEMLNMGFREDIETILAKMPEDRQMALFSATMPKAILEITRDFQKSDTVILRVAAKELTIPTVKQYYYEVKKSNKEDAAARLIDYYNPKKTLIFCNTKRMVDTLAENLRGRGYSAEGLHGDLSQGQRDRVMHSFRGEMIDVLIATDVAARGIDVDDVEAVINYDIPQDIEYYVHRIGRTGRAGKKGRAFTLVVGRDVFKIRDIERACQTHVTARKLPSAEDLTKRKAHSVLKEGLETLQLGGLEEMEHLIEETCNDEECTALELAAAFLKSQMGVKVVDIPTEDYFKDRKKETGSRNRSFGDKSRGGQSHRDNYRGNKDGNRDGRKFGNRSEGRRDGARSEGRKYEGRRDGARPEGRKYEGSRDGARPEGRKYEGSREGARPEGRKYESRKSEGTRSEGRKYEGRREGARPEGRKSEGRRDGARSESRKYESHRDGARSEGRREGSRSYDGRKSEGRREGNDNASWRSSHKDSEGKN